MSSPYEDRAGMLLKAKKKELRELKKKILSETGFFGKRKLKNEIKNTTKDIEYLRNDIYLYRRAVAWNKKKALKTIRRE